MTRTKKSRTEYHGRRKLRAKAGMTMAEMLITVAIITVLMGVGFIALTGYQKSMAQLERDGNAKQIFIAAQNHLTLARGEGYLLGSESSASFGSEETGSDDVYYVVSGNSSYTTVLDMMLPFGSIDETVRSGGSYIIRYQPSTAKVLDVFYTTKSGSPERFNHTLAATEYSTLLESYTGADKKSDRKDNYQSGAILGWYGGTEAADLDTVDLSDSLTLNVYNSHTLYAEVTALSDVSCVLNIKGTRSGAKLSVTLNGNSTTNEHIGEAASSDGLINYTYVVDDISRSGMHFADLSSSTDAKFIPGEDLEFQAVAQSTDALGIEYTDIVTENSLFAEISEETPAGDTSSSIFKASVNTIRHLENIEEEISNLGYNPNASANTGISLTTVYQTADIDLSEFETSTETGSEKKIYKYGDTDGISRYYPVSPESALIYDGLSHSISNITVVTANDGSAGLFGTMQSGSKVKNLALTDPDISGSSASYAGALAGRVSSTNINNVVAYSTVSGRDVTVKASAAAGGLIGEVNAGSVMYSAAALVVKATGESSNAGGLVGKAADVTGTVQGESETETTTATYKPTFKACYSGGHTVDGRYYEDETVDAPIYNVTAGSSGNAGGLIGDAGDSKINMCYSTCSASGGTSGGLAGTANSATISNSYSTGLVSGNYAFLGDGSASGTNNSYYEIVNEIADDDGNLTGEYKIPVSSSTNVSNFIAPFDEMLESDTASEDYDPRSAILLGTASGWRDAVPYDSDIKAYYNGKYSLEGVTQLAADGYNSTKGTGLDAIGTSYFVNTHYGDWPAPEIFIINE